VEVLSPERFEDVIEGVLTIKPIFNVVEARFAKVRVMTATLMDPIRYLWVIVHGVMLTTGATGDSRLFRGAILQTSEGRSVNGTTTSASLKLLRYVDLMLHPLCQVLDR